MNRTKELFVAEFDWDGGIELFLRENGTYKVIETSWLHGQQSYGHYKLDGNLIFLDHTIRLGAVEVMDTLKYDSLGLHFTLVRDWKNLSSGIMIIRKNELLKMSTIVE